MGRAGVDESMKWGGVGVREEFNGEGQGVGKSGRVETDNLFRAGDVNAVLAMRGCRRTADYFFVSEETSTIFANSGAKEAGADEADTAHPLAVIEFFFRQSFSLCLEAPQKRQRLFVNLRWCSSCVNLPSLPSMSEYGLVRDFEDEDDDDDLLEELPEDLLPDDLDD